MTIHDIARSAGTSERRLYVLFRQHLTKNPIHPYSDLAPESGHRPPSLPIIEIAHRAGYADQSALTHTLKKARNLAPVSLRKQARDH